MAWITAAAIVGSALIGGASSNEAAETSAEGANRAAEVQMEMFQQQREDSAPWRRAGQVALGAMGDMMGLNFGGGGSVASNATTMPANTTIRRDPMANVPPGKIPLIGGYQPGRMIPKTGSVGSNAAVSGFGKSLDIKTRALGGPLNSGDVALVGERGPEPITDMRGRPMGVVGNSGPEIIRANKAMMVHPNDRMALPGDFRDPRRGGGYDGSGINPNGMYDDRNLPSYEDLIYGSHGDSIHHPDGSITDLSGAGSEDFEDGGSERTPYNWRTDPGYQFRFDEGVRAVLANAAASGYSGSGRVGRELTRYGQGIASQEYGNVWNRLAAISGVGQTAINSTPYAQFAGQIGGSYQNAANAQAAGIMGVGNAIGNGLGQWAYWNAFNGG